jgi:hypothetical protein
MDRCNDFESDQRQPSEGAKQRGCRERMAAARKGGGEQGPFGIGLQDAQLHLFAGW